MTLTRAEQETFIYLSPADKEACIYSSDPSWIKRLEKLAEKRPDLFHLTKQYEDSVEYSCPKKCVKVGPPR